MAHNQFELLKTRRFLPFFITQFLGAFNDNVFKNTIIVIISYEIFANNSSASDLWVNIAVALFIFPFFIFSGTAGQLADKYDKAKIMQWVKFFEIIIMTIATFALYSKSVIFMVSILFLMGTQSAFFGPAKYALLPQHLKENELLGGNGLVEMGTFVAILFGLIVGGVLITLSHGFLITSTTIVLIAIAGFLASRKIPESEIVDPQLKINWNFITETSRVIKHARENKVVFLAILGISWFWFFGALILTQLPNFAKVNLGGNNQVFTLLLATFTLGVAIGSLLCEKLSGRMIEIGLVPFGALGLTAFSVDLYFASNHLASGPLIGWLEFLKHGNFRILLDIAFIGMFGGFYIVPLYALIQKITEERILARIIAANNIINSGFMVLSAIMAIILLSLNFSIPELFLINGILNALVVIYIIKRVPEFLMRFLIWMLLHTMYRVKHKGLENIPVDGAAVLVCNHVSFVDPLIIAGFANRPVRFVMDHQIFKIPVLNFIFRTAKAIPIAPEKEDAEMKKKAFETIEKALQNGELVAIFPEGKITYDGRLNAFKPGIEEIIKKTPVPVIPMALQGLWGSFFSRRGGKAMKGLPRRFFSKIGLVADKEISAEIANADFLQQKVRDLRGDLR
ncbi:MAG TPA: MFS transporter [Aeromonadales bacterium]|nr:MFS transporter [Aeromonadales bacterium]